MGTCSNIGAGQTELVLSTIYWILTKFVLGDAENPKENNVNKIFQTKFGEQCINEALSILSRNLLRVSDMPEEDVEKNALSMSILNFIKASTKAPYMKKYMLFKNHYFKQILMNEDLYSSSSINEMPVDIENTICGDQMTTLIETISGINSI